MSATSLKLIKVFTRSSSDIESAMLGSGALISGDSSGQGKVRCKLEKEIQVDLDTRSEMQTYSRWKKTSRYHLVCEKF